MNQLWKDSNNVGDNRLEDLKKNLESWESYEKQRNTLDGHIDGAQKEFEDKSSNDILKKLKEEGTPKLYPSRILNLGMYKVISNCPDFIGGNESETNKIISDIFEKLNLSTNKAEKDIGIYKSTISKMEQAKELIEELKIKDKKKENKQ